MLSLVVLLAGVLASFPVALCASQNKVALVIGNSNYTNAGHLPHPVSDATAMAEKLERLGFHVTTKTDLSRKAMESALAALESAARDSILVFYYAGHAMQIKGKNWFLPVDFQLAYPESSGNPEQAIEAAISGQALDLARVLRAMEYSHPKLMILILDACRNNDLGLNIRGGLAEVHARPGTLFAYAAKPGGVAWDGSGAHSIYTGALLKYMGMSCISLNDMLNAVGKEVFELSRAIIAKYRLDDAPQEPWVSHSPMTSFSFAGCRNWEEMEALLTNFKVAFESENLAGLKRIVDLSDTQSRHIQEIFRRFHAIELQTSHPNMKSPGLATAKARISAALNDAGNLVTPPARWGDLYLTARKDQGAWEHLQLEWGLDHEE